MFYKKLYKWALHEIAVLMAVRQAMFQWMLVGTLLTPDTGLDTCRGQPDPRKALWDAIHSYD